ncbi:MAG: hypothetical protein COX81_00320 [Candidatus Magasanikbacteria bacterium CG_4_10_14_0_2_um_filter_37_12]|uniref:Cell division protein FtsL n=1 Tax=Candidatus Magasanikbacteria bacterium CG_4_10_14_0_2_um_filter_37_12 TaxID=1974637 RepID=A0A2M7V9X6_9BACT|nr:MAG: hypothetical protein COX81_00320 [Candidatus Magasanikbacteria bacterium CG_4_10_14_0_2_um_filter_37_12]
MNAYLIQKPTLRQKKQAVQKWLVSRSFRAILIMLMVVFGVLYLFQTNAVSTKGFDISHLEKQIVELERETRKLDVKIAEYRSINSVQERLSTLNLVATNSVEYLTPVGTEVAFR